MDKFFFGRVGDRITKAGILICGIALVIILASHVWGC